MNNLNTEIDISLNHILLNSCHIVTDKIYLVLLILRLDTGVKSIYASLLNTKINTLIFEQRF